MAEVPAGRGGCDDRRPGRGRPDVPSFTELGEPELVASPCFGAPAPVVERLRAEATATLPSPEVPPRLVETGATPRRMAAAAQPVFAAAEGGRWAAVVQAAGIRAERPHLTAAPRLPFSRRMDDDPATPPKPSARQEATRTAQAEREARLAAALRANLRRRKAQARAREAATKPDTPPGKG